MESRKLELDKLSETDIKLALYMQELFDGFYSNKGLQYLVDKLRELFDRPLVLYDTGYKILAASFDADKVFQFSEAENASHYISEDTMSFIRSNHITEELRTKNILDDKTKEAPGQRTLCATIKIDMIEVAQLSVYEAGQQFQDIDYLLINKSSSLLSAQLQRSILLNLDHNQLPSYILVDLVEGKPIDDSILRNRQFYLKWLRTDNLCIIVVSCSRQESFDNKMAVVFRTLKTFIPIDQCIIYKSSIVAFIDEILCEALFNTHSGNFSKFLKDNNLYAGISQKYSLLTDSKKHYQNAVSALEIGMKRNINCSLFDDCSLFIISELLSAKFDVMDFCHPAVYTLMTHDKKTGSELLNTLKQYIYYSSNPTQAARELNIHRNTLFYRIGKIKDMTGIGLEYGDEICKLFLSIRLLEIKGVIE